MTFNNSALTFKRLKDIVPHLLDDEVGIISYVQELPRQYDMPDFIYYKGEIADTGIFDVQPNRSTSGGTSLTRDHAIAKAVGEAVERYSSAIYFPEELLLSSYRSLTQPAVHPSEFRIHTAGQIGHQDYPLDPFDEDTEVRWVRAIHWKSQKHILIPAAFVYCPYSPEPKSREGNIAESISTGLAAHCSLAEAAVNGILEVVERDAFMLHWLANISCPVITPDSLTTLHQEMIRRYAVCGYAVNVLFVRTDTGIPTVFCVMHGQRDNNVPFIISSATHLDPVAAISKCLEELALMERLCKRVMLTPHIWPAGEPHQHIVKLIDHLKFWLNPEMIPSADFLISKTEHISLQELSDLSTGNPEEDLATVVQRIEDTGYQVCIGDVTFSDIETLGMRVVRAVIPGYLPLTVHYRCRPEGSKRLQAFLHTKQQTENNATSRINPTPHPFA